MIAYCGIGDEAGSALSEQIAALRSLHWNLLEVRNLPGGNFHNVSDAEFDVAWEALQEAHIAIDCYASEVANWQRSPLSAADETACMEMLERLLKRMRKTGTRKLRGMSFKWQLDRAPWDREVEQAVFRKVRKLVERCADSGVVYLHENCMNYGGQSWEHTLRLLDALNGNPAFGLIFDTGNPVFAPDRRFEDQRRQNALEFFLAVQPFVRHVHIKDGVWDAATEQVRFSWPGEGEGRVPEILEALVKAHYDGVLSIEPHLARVFHADDPAAKDVRSPREIFIEYGERLQTLVHQAQLKVGC